MLVLGGLALTGLAAVLAVNFLVLPSLVHSRQVVAMPDLRGLDLEEARSKGDDLQLIIEVSRRKAHPTLPPGAIVSQMPDPGERIRGGRVVRVVVSAGHPSGALPQVVGLTPRQAEATLQRENYRPGRKVAVFRPEITQPVVAYQRPQAGTELATGQTVDLVVAEPAPTVILRMPDLTGVPLYQARRLVTGAGLVLAPVEYRRTDGATPNHVVAQEPQAGSRVSRGDRLVLVVATR